MPAGGLFVTQVPGLGVVDPLTYHTSIARPVHRTTQS